MAVDTYLVLTPYAGAGFGQALKTESQAKLGLKDLGTGAAIVDNTLLEIADYSLDVEQTLAIGSAGSGAGAGKIKFNPFSISKTIDILTPALFQLCASGKAFAKLDLLLVKSTGAPTSLLFLQYTFKLAAVATVSFSHDEVTPRETVTFEYGDLQIRYQQQRSDGTTTGAPVTAGWNIVKNIADISTQPI